MNPTPHLVHVFPSFGSGGTELRIVGIINALGDAIRHSILPLNGRSDAATRIDPSLSVSILRAPEAQRPVAWWIDLTRTLRAAQPNLILTYNWGAIEATLAARITSISPVIHNESGFGPDESQHLKWRRVVARRAILNRIHATVVNSRKLREVALNQYKIQSRKIRFIRNGVDTAKFSPGHNRELRDSLGLQGHALLFGYLGNYRAEKNLPLLLRAFARVKPEAKLALIGDGPCRADLEQLAASLGIAGRVLFTGQTKDPGPFLQALDVFVLPSMTEQTPNALLEAMACGLPAVSTDVGDTRELLNASGPPVIVPSGNEEALAAALASMAADPELRKRAGAANRERCLECYSLERMVREFADLYHAAIRSPI